MRSTRTGPAWYNAPMPDPLEDLASIIAAKALERLRAERIGSGKATCITPADQPKECEPGGCAPCEENPGCAAREMREIGTARLTPLAIRTSRDLAPYIDHTLLKPEATREDLVKLCDEARKYGFATVCLNSSNIGLAKRLLEGSPVKPIAVVGFPLGAGTTSAKSFE